jgi:DNA polymerase-1
VHVSSTMSKILALDTETTIYNNGNPYDSRNKLVCYSWADYLGYGGAELWDGFSIDLRPYDLVVGFNFKFDLHWFEKEGVSFDGVEIWDVQIAEFIISCQTNRLPSLNDVCQKYGLPLKKDVVKTEYWDKGIDTDQIPWDILREYAAHDAWLTLQCYYQQIKEMTPAQIKLCKLQCQDLKILREMECNGVPFDENLCHTKSLELDDKISAINRELSQIYPNVPINFNSSDQLSAFLYGGTIKEDGKEHIGFYKTGERAGQPKYKNIIIEHQLPRLYKPIPNTEMAKEGIYSTNEGVLKKLKGKKGIIDKILELSKLEKMNGTYYKGLVKLRQEMNWEPGVLHGNFNQTIAATGRLSSNKPNLQNFASELQDVFVSRYDD